MIEESLLKKNFVGRDGFFWWIGQVVDSNTWKRNSPELPVGSQSDLPGFKRRVKVRIMGYHTADTTALSDNDLPWAYCMMPVTAGGSMGGMSQSVNFSGGEFVFGFFLDGEDAQQPIIMGVLDKSSQLNFGKEIPRIGFTPFQGYTNGLVESTHNIKKDGAPGTTDTSSPPVSTGGNSAAGGGGTKIAPTLATESAVAENPQRDVNDHGTYQAHENMKNTGETKPSQKCADDNPGEGINLVLRRLQKQVAFIQKQQGIFLDPINLKVNNIQNEIARAKDGIAAYVKDIMERVRGVMTKEVAERAAKLSIKLPIDKMGDFKDTLDDALEGLGCLFENIIGGLEDTLNGLLQDMIGKVTGALDCIINDVIGNMLSTALDAVNGILDSITGVLDSLLGAIGAIKLPLMMAADFLAALKALFTCKEETECTEISQFNALYGNQSEKPSDFLGLVSKALGGGSFVPEPIGSLLEAGSNVVGSVQGAIDSAANAVETIAGIPGQALDALQSCNPFADTCEPPLAVIFGGGIVETKVNTIVNQAGNIIGVDLDGSDALNAIYNSVPSVNFNSNCGTGGGASGRVILNDDGSINKVVIDEPGTGYLPAPDGSVGASGQVFADSTQTIVRTEDGEQIAIKPNKSVTAPSGSTIFIPSGGSVVLPEGTVDQNGNSVSGITTGKGLTDGNGFTITTETSIITPNPVKGSKVVSGIATGGRNTISNISDIENIRIGSLVEIIPVITSTRPTGTPIVGSTLATGGSTPVTAGGDPVTAGGDPVTAGGTDGIPLVSGAVGGTPVTAGGDPVTVGGVGGTPITAGGDPVTSNGIPLTAGGIGGTPVTVGGVGGSPVTSNGNPVISSGTITGGTGSIETPSYSTTTTRISDRNLGPGGLSLPFNTTIVDIVGTSIILSDNVLGDATATVDLTINFVVSDPLDYPVVMELDEINVDKTGISYNNGDTITVTGDGNTLTLQPVLSVNGSILDVKIPDDQRGLGFTNVPTVTINTKTGAGAKLTPYLRIKYRGRDNIQQVLDQVTQDQIISVVDCVGKINV